MSDKIRLLYDDEVYQVARHYAQRALREYDNQLANDQSDDQSNLQEHVLNTVVFDYFGSNFPLNTKDEEEDLEEKSLNEVEDNFLEEDVDDDIIIDESSFPDEYPFKESEEHDEINLQEDEVEETSPYVFVEPEEQESPEQSFKLEFFDEVEIEETPKQHSVSDSHDDTPLSLLDLVRQKNESQSSFSFDKHDGDDFTFESSQRKPSHEDSHEIVEEKSTEYIVDLDSPQKVQENSSKAQSVPFFEATNDDDLDALNNYRPADDFSPLEEESVVEHQEAKVQQPVTTNDWGLFETVENVEGKDNTPSRPRRIKLDGLSDIE